MRALMAASAGRCYRTGRLTTTCPPYGTGRDWDAPLMTRRAPRGARYAVIRRPAAQRYQYSQAGGPRARAFSPYHRSTISSPSGSCMVMPSTSAS